MRAIRSGSAGFVAIIVLIGGCAAHEQPNGLTIGAIQKDLHRGMTQSEVTATFGAPNIVSKDEMGREVWTYDRVTKQSASRWFLFWRSGASSQQTLTLLITFDSEVVDADREPIWTVADFAYHGTQF